MTPKKIFIIVFVVGILSSLAAGTYYWKFASQKSVDSELPSDVTPTPVPEELLEWKDQAGFTFSYPASLKSDIHEEDQLNYAHIEFTHPENPGSIIIWAKDTASIDVAGWVKAEKTLAGGTILDTTFADMDGKKILVASPKKKVVTAVVDDAIVFYVEGEFENSDFWTKTYDTITSTFAFTTTQTSGGSSVPSGEDNEQIMVDEEEVLE